jgi:hypothetical protein
MEIKSSQIKFIDNYSNLQEARTLLDSFNSPCRRTSEPIDNNKHLFEYADLLNDSITKQLINKIPDSVEMVSNYIKAIGEESELIEVVQLMASLRVVGYTYDIDSNGNHYIEVKNQNLQITKQLINALITDS